MAVAAPMNHATAAEPSQPGSRSSLTNQVLRAKRSARFSTSRLRAFVPPFLKWFSETLFPEEVRLPIETVDVGREGPEACPPRGDVARRGVRVLPGSLWRLARTWARIGWDPVRSCRVLLLVVVHPLTPAPARARHNFI